MIASVAAVMVLPPVPVVRAGRLKSLSYQWASLRRCGRNCRYISTTLAGLLPPPLSFLSIDIACVFPFWPAPGDKVRE
jgi:hypothetical protein